MNKTQQQTKEWQFYKITVACVGEEPMVGIINEYIDNAINEMANKGSVIYSNETTVKKEDEELGALLRANAFDVKESLVFYHNELERQGIIGEGCLLDDEKAKILFYTLGKMVERIQCDNTNPMRLRNDLAEIITEFDKMPIMGILFQILLLQGVAIMLERLKIDEGDSGFDEALSLYNWIMEFLGKKEVRFCFMPYGENDIQLLKPFCDYLMSTDMGKAVQSSVFKTNIDTEEPQTPPTGEKQGETDDLEIPVQLKNEKAKAIFDKAEQAGFISKDGQRYKWNKTDENTYQLLSYFCEKMSRYLNLSKKSDKNGNPTTSWKPFEKLFGVKNLISYKNDWLKCYTTFNPKGCERIDALFE